MTVFTLQIIAMVTMFIDHLGNILFHDLSILRHIGRLAFPIYAFLLVETYRHIRQDSERVYSHLRNYIFLALISEFIYDLTEFDCYSITYISKSQNVIFTLLFGYIGLIAIDKWKDTNKLYMYSTMLVTAIIDYVAYFNYRFSGVLLIYAFYYYLEKYENEKYIVKLSALILVIAVYIPFYHWARYDFSSLEVFVENLNPYNLSYYACLMPIPFILATYNGKLGYTSKKYKTLFRYFYPAHLLILWIIKKIFFL